MLEIQPKRILMTGGGSSVGNSLRCRLIHQGHDVCSVGINGPDYECDFTASAPVMQVRIEHLFGHFGIPDVLINNAALTRIDFAEDHSAVDFEEVYRVNLMAPFLFVSEMMARIAAEKVPHGEQPLRRIISTSSMGTKTSLRGSPGYCATKAGIEALTKMWAKEFAGKHRVITAAIAPGSIENTDMARQCIKELMRTRGMTQEEAEAYNTQSPLRRHVTHDELWAMFDFAVNKMPEYCSGTILYMTGGTGL